MITILSVLGAAQRQTAQMKLVEIEGDLGTVPVVDQLYYNDLIDSGETGKILVQQLHGILSMLVMGPLVSYLQAAEMLLAWSERFTTDLGQAARVRAAWLVRGAPTHARSSHITSLQIPPPRAC